MQFEFASQIWLDAYLYVEQQLNEPLLKLKNLNLKDFRGKQPARQAKDVRAALGLKPDDPVYSVPSVMNRFGIRAVEVDTEEAIDGLAAVYGEEYVTVLARGLGADRSRMSAAHELGHFVAGDVDESLPEPDADDRAFAFGFHFLMPASVLKRAINRRSMVHLVEMKKQYGVSLAAMIYRAEKEQFPLPRPRLVLFG